MYVIMVDIFRAARYPRSLRRGIMLDKKPTTIRLSAEARRLLDALSARLGVSHTAVIELAIREKAQREDVKAKES